MSEPSATPTGGFDLNRPTIIGLLFAAGYFTVITAIIAVVLCYVWRGEPHEPWEATHYDYHIRTFWGSVIGTIIGTILLIVLIGFLILPLVGLWSLIRVVLSLVNAQKRTAMPNPQTLFF
jgi:uncharacterized membrane protein